MSVAGGACVVWGVQAVVWILGLIGGIVPFSSCQHECVLPTVEAAEDKIGRIITLVCDLLRWVSAAVRDPHAPEGRPGEIREVIAPPGHVGCIRPISPIEVVGVLVRQIVIFRKAVAKPEGEKKLAPGGSPDLEIKRDCPSAGFTVSAPIPM